MLFGVSVETEASFSRKKTQNYYRFKFRGYVFTFLGSGSDLLLWKILIFLKLLKKEVIRQDETTTTATTPVMDGIGTILLSC
jgi:hypothetical protein